jgi:hypothetical protein
LADSRDCVTVNVRRAAFNVPVRCVPPLLGATEYSSDPLPVPLAPEVIVIQLAALVAVHEQVFDDAATNGPPAAATPWLAGEIENVQLQPIFVTNASEHGLANPSQTPPLDEC